MTDLLMNKIENTLKIYWRNNSINSKSKKNKYSILKESSSETSYKAEKWKSDTTNK